MPAEGAVLATTPHVLIDATAVPTDHGGVGRYVDSLIRELAATGEVSLTVSCQLADAERYARLSPRARIVPGPAAIAHRPARLAWEQTGLPLLAASVAADIIHCPHYTMPLRADRPVVVTLHDATFFTHPHLHRKVKASFFRSATRIALRRAARCIVPSLATRDELVRILAADSQALDVAYHGVNLDDFHPPSELEKKSVRDRLGLSENPYVAFLGTLEPRKNVPQLIRGWIEACEGRDRSPVLVLAGQPGWDDEIDRACNEVPPELRLLRPGYLPLCDLPGFLGGAQVVAYPSKGEGFGLPVLEALACGAPVMCTPELALREVGGNAVSYCGLDSHSIGLALRRLLDDQPERARLKAAGPARAGQFTWAASARVHLRSYTAAIGVP